MNKRKSSFTREEKCRLNNYLSYLENNGDIENYCFRRWNGHWSLTNKQKRELLEDEKTDIDYDFSCIAGSCSDLNDM